MLCIESEELKGLQDFDAYQLRVLKEECSTLLAIVEDWGALLSKARISEEEALADLGLARNRIAV